jgi:hypothetical protein
MVLLKLPNALDFSFNDSHHRQWIRESTCRSCENVTGQQHSENESCGIKEQPPRHPYLSLDRLLSQISGNYVLVKLQGDPSHFL